ncbi:conserved exported hypothetical protein [uncultured Pleomorphomonas sp.]|uniref:Ribbon-helix-helix protein CopG domain-containing protein n=1 Tax=uncultured Pleomorphomonas sp. TaxID=442121 RepID=A0A212L214_9HYPH|nr:conserved exported hypothetical protein [uncultured Pleomorphomonas sp.]
MAVAPASSMSMRSANSLACAIRVSTVWADVVECLSAWDMVASAALGSGLGPVWKLLLPIGLCFMYNTYIMTSISVKHKKRGRPATGKTPITGVRLPDDVGEALERFAETAFEKPSRSEAIRHILKEWLREKGYLSG